MLLIFNNWLSKNLVDLIKFTGLLILVTIVLSLTIGFFYDFIALLTGKTVSQSWNLFIYAFVKVLQGASIGYVVGLIMGFAIAARTPASKSGIMSINLADFGKIINFTACLLICWLMGIVACAIEVGGNYFRG